MNCGQLNGIRIKPKRPLGNRNFLRGFVFNMALPYGELLKDPRWQRKRSEIMIRDKFTCQMCGTNEDTLNVHHLAYAPNGKPPWDVPDSGLITICEECHAMEERYKREYHQQLLRTFGFLGYSNSEIQDLTSSMVPLFDLNPEQFKEEFQSFVNDYIQRNQNG